MSWKTKQNEKAIIFFCRDFFFLVRVREQSTTGVRRLVLKVTREVTPCTCCCTCTATQTDSIDSSIDDSDEEDDGEEMFSAVLQMFYGD